MPIIITINLDPDGNPLTPDGFITLDTNGDGTPEATIPVLGLCFLPGTQISTPQGPVAIDALKRGDLVTTADGATEPVRWIGRQTVSKTFAGSSMPICVKAGALGENLPVRDLFVSPGHALMVDGVLVEAGALINGTSIVRHTDMPETFTYFNVELAEHSLILAEGTQAESFVDNVSRRAFDNWAEHEALGDTAPIAEMDLPRAKASRQVPAAIQQRLAARAGALFGSVAAKAA